MTALLEVHDVTKSFGAVAPVRGGRNGEIGLGPPTEFTAGNIDTFGS